MGAAATIKVPKSARTIDASGKFLLPGFWDMHVHLAGINADPSWSQQVLLPLLLANGITGFRGFQARKSGRTFFGSVSRSRCEIE